MFLTVRDGPHRSCPKAHRVPVHPKGLLHSYLPLSRHRSSLSQAPRLGYLPSPHSAFQEYAAHMARWPTMLSSKGSWRVGRIRARYLTARLPNPPVRPVRETFASYGSRARDIMRKVHFASSTVHSPWTACACAGYLCTVSRPSPSGPSPCT